MPWSRMHLYHRLLLGLAPVKVVLVHLELLMEYWLLQTWLLMRWILWLQCFRGWNHRTLSSMRSRVNWPTLFFGSMLKVVWAPSLLCLLQMFSYFVFIYVFLDLDYFLFAAYLMYLESIFDSIYIYVSLLLLRQKGEEHSLHILTHLNKEIKGDNKKKIGRTYNI